MVEDEGKQGLLISKEAAVIPVVHIDVWFLSQSRDIAARIRGSWAVG